MLVCYVAGSLSVPLYQSENLLGAPALSIRTQTQSRAHFRFQVVYSGELCHLRFNETSCDNNTFPLVATRPSSDRYESFCRSPSTIAIAWKSQCIESLGRLLAFVGVRLLDFIDNSHHINTTTSISSSLGTLLFLFSCVPIESALSLFPCGTSNNHSSTWPRNLHQIIASCSG